MELEQYLGIVRRHWIAIVMCVAIGLGGSAGWTLLQDPEYRADSSGIVTAAFSTDGAYVDSLSAAIATQDLSVSAVRTYVGLGESRNVAQYAIDKLGLEVSPSQLVGRVSVSSPPDTAIITAVARASSPELARDIADAWIEGIAAEIVSIQATASGVVILRPSESAVLPATPSSPNVRLALALGLLVGAAVGVAYAVLRSVLDRRIRSRAQLERAFEAPIIGAIPHLQGLRSESLLRVDEANGQPTSQRADTDRRMLEESVRKLRTNLQYMDVDDPARVVIVTSGVPGEGKSTLAANLAIAIAETGQRVILIDGDLRKPRVASIFQLPDDIGLTDVLMRRASIVDAARRWGPSGTLALISSGPLPPNPSELLGSEAMSTLLTTLSSEALVVIDAPPLLPVTDAAVLASRAGVGVIVVARARRATVDAVRESLESLRLAGARVLGLVLNDAPVRGADAEASSKERYSGYYDAAPRELAGQRDDELDAAPALARTAEIIPVHPRTSVDSEQELRRTSGD